ncbi:hypothetical protein [Chitinophaga nivalis]|uniref:Uncharacterized protein n=1 Tax=Chitinophaga nivalis TaxID=2991709 RepID=A0ABT3IS70_9BACT|nr:hypothetical protein [Chitinophaga nivalis]MCW3463485.1 hypothetical protein [Chitinophaga nivalis]MCW3486825.1 hypothetical protein [Chitinophaga nivalis]
MSSLQKFNSTLEDFDKEITKLKSVGEVFNEIRALAASYETVIGSIAQSNAALENVLQQHLTFQDNVKDKIREMAAQQALYKTDLQQLLESKIADLREQQKKFEKVLTEEVEQLRKENKQFYRDLEETLRIKLSEHKSEIKKFVTTATESATTQVVKALEAHTAAIRQQQQKILLAVLLTGGVLIGAVVFVIYRLLQ